MSGPFGLVIFDCDGVLVDSERLSVRVDALVLAEIGWPLSEAEVVERFVGRSHEDMVAEIEAHLGRPLPADWEEPYRHLYWDTPSRPSCGPWRASSGRWTGSTR